MANIPIAADPSTIIVDVLDQHLDAPVEHLPQGVAPAAPAVPTLRVRPLLAPPPSYNRTTGVHEVTVQILSVNPAGHESLLDLLPEVARDHQLAGDKGVIVSMALNKPSRSIVAGAVVHAARVKAVVAERAPALAGVPFEYRMKAEAERLAGVVGASSVDDVLHGTKLPPRGSATTTLRANMVFSSPESSAHELQGQTKKALLAQRGWNVEGVGNIGNPKVDAAYRALEDGQPVGVVPVRVGYRSRI